MISPRPRRIMFWIAFFFLAIPLATQGRHASAAPQTSEAAPTPADQALSDTTWYDADAGEVLPIHVKPVIDDSLNRDSRWLPKAKRVAQPKPVTPAGGAGAGAGAGVGLFGSGLTIGNLFGWVLLVAILGAAVALLVYAFSKTEIDLGNDMKKRKQVDSTPDEQTIERMKHLPAELRRTDVNLRSEAERLMNAGQFEQAIILLFGHQLLLLDRAGILRLNRGKTNGKYVRETRAVDPESATRLRATVTAFERSYFGRHEIDQEEFAELWQGNLELEQAVQRRQELAA